MKTTLIILFFSFSQIHSLPDSHYLQAETKLKTFSSLQDLEEIEDLLEDSRRPGIKVFDTLFEVYFFGDLGKNIERNHTKAVKYLNKGLKYRSSKAVFAAAVIFQQILLTDQFLEFETNIEIEVFEAKGLKSRHDGFDLLEVSYFASVFECLLLQDVQVPEMLRPNNKDLKKRKLFDEENDEELGQNDEELGEDDEELGEDDDEFSENDDEFSENDDEFITNDLWETIYPVMEEKNCGFDRSLVFSAISQAYYARDYIEDLGRPPHEITQESLISDISYGSDSEEMLNKVDKLYSNYKFSKGIENLGQEYLHGNNLLGIDPNYEEALNYFSKSVDLGNPSAIANLGKMYLKGLGVDQNTTKGLEYLEQAAEAGSLEALRQLSVLYQRGELVVRNKTKAFSYSRKAADKGDVQSLNNIGVYYLEGIGVEANPSLGVDYIEKAASLGSPAAMYNLATVYFNGDHREVDLEYAFELSLKVIHAAQQDGFMEKAYERFKKKDFEGAFLYFLFAESLGYVEASKSLAYLIDKGMTTFKCKSGMFYCLGRHLFRGVLMNDPHSYLQLGDLMYYGKHGHPADYKSALLFYSLSPNSGESLFHMAYMLENGLGTQKDPERALKLYNKILELSESQQIDYYAKFPALLSKLFITLKQLLSKIFNF